MYVPFLPAPNVSCRLKFVPSPSLQSLSQSPNVPIISFHGYHIVPDGQHIMTALSPKID